MKARIWSLGLAGLLACATGAVAVTYYIDDNSNVGDVYIQIAEILSNREPFIRVDLYDCGRPVFGELTLHPEAGLGHFTPPEWDLRFGARW